MANQSGHGAGTRVYRTTSFDRQGKIDRERSKMTKTTTSKRMKKDLTVRLGSRRPVK